jgi:hypothetical protein
MLEVPLNGRQLVLKTGHGGEPMRAPDRASNWRGRSSEALRALMKKQSQCERRIARAIGEGAAAKRCGALMKKQSQCERRIARAIGEAQQRTKCSVAEPSNK